MTKRRVVVTGLGMLSPLGNSVEDTWSRLIAGQSGIDYITRFDTEQFSVKIGGELKELDTQAYIDRKEARRMDAFMQYGVIAAMQAVEDAKLETLSAEQKARTGVAMGSGIGGIETIETVRSVMENAAAPAVQIDVPLTVDAGQGANWAQAH